MGPTPMWLVSLQMEAIRTQTHPGLRLRRRNLQTAIFEPRRRTLEENNSVAILASDFWPPELQEIKFHY